jgi:hypothetical protein
MLNHAVVELLDHGCNHMIWFIIPVFKVLSSCENTVRPPALA